MSSPAHTLLARALRSLTDEEQGIVLSTLLGPAGHGADPRTWVRQGAVQFPLPDQWPTDKVGFLLRLPLATHQALKVWADENGHSMNVVVRGLVERFLDEQGDPPAAPSA